MSQQWIVAAIVACAFWAVARRYMPKAMRQALRRWTVQRARGFGLDGVAARLEARADAGGSCGDGCGSCGSCGPAPKEGGPKEFSVSVEALKRTASR